ncbi:DUF4253 domain-containing protein [Mesobacillus selenatarsenatis]|uniref:DUF4253 domain-containing protein n=1 Tax=Mesobacillus selenatarsenatis TaxID=388741 RepID=A0A846TLN8_9BACI|nr:DUF4253 domain-containing protein [Mesobacillus selenatarsenatis]NKE06542.1 DUF4253 domain-containing protein [Mesobacillus selenatarsenatis]
MNLKKLLSFGKSKKAEIKIEECSISEEAMTIVKRYSNSRLLPFYNQDLYSEKPVKIAGVCVKCKQDETELLALKLREELKAINYLAFICDSNREKVAMIPGSDQFEILKIQQTNGDNYEISNRSVISKLKEYYRSYPFTIIDADYDWVEVEFEVLPNGKELKAFAREIAEFCPDLVEQGTGSINDLMEEIKGTRKLSLWWD